MLESGPEFKAVVIGTGFAGAVTACRLTQAGLRICVLERGRRYGPGDFPIYPTERPSAVSAEGAGEEGGYIQPDLSRCFWKWGHGLWDIRDLGDVVAAQAAGYGGGSLIYANVHLRAPAEVFDHDWPSDYQGDKLEPYYDLAAYMLDVKPIPETLPKTVQMKRAAEKLGRHAQYFRPPLAVNFEQLKNGKNKHDHEQGVCDMRGDCCFGCPVQAKNTLDLNYLWIAEREVDEKGQPLADIRTLAEVVSIKQVQNDKSGESFYEVEYCDHLYGKPPETNHEVKAREPKTVTANHVFLCAGAINSTELLLRCHEAKKLHCKGKGLGDRYYPNADTLTAVFDCDELQEMDRGPTITAAILYNRESDDNSRRDWFLVEDGGMPKDLEPLLGVFRSPLWVRRNRYREVPASKSSKSQPTSYAQLPFETVMDVFSGLTRSAIRPRLPLAHAVSEHLLSTMQAGRDFEWSPETYDRYIRRWRLLPTQLREALEANRDEALDAVAAAAEPRVVDFLEEAARRMEEQYDLEEDILKSFPLSGLAVGGIKDLHLARRFLRLSVQLIWGSEGDMVRHVVDNLLGRLMREPKGLVKRASDLLRWALDYRVSDGHTALLLSMGRDSQKGMLSLVTPSEPSVGSTITGDQSGASGTLVGSPTLTSGRWAKNDAAGMLVLTKVRGEFKPGETLIVGARTIGTYPSDVPQDIMRAMQSRELYPIPFKPKPQQGNAREFLEGIQVGKSSDVQYLPKASLRARLPRPLHTPERITQERLLRDIATTAWRGELRTNPAWNFLDRRLTVHSQGGCPMGENEDHGVTDSNGMVFGCPGLYVMDAAAFPTPVGVNPSATIAAIAEYKVEQFIQHKLGKKHWKALQKDEAKRWVDRNRDQIDPIRKRTEPSPPPVHQPIGITFTETMKGFHFEIPGGGQAHDLRFFRSHELRKIDSLASIVTKLDAELDDLTRFLELHREGRPAKIRIRGHVEIEGWPESQSTTFPLGDDSHFELFLQGGHANQDSEQRTISYKLYFSVHDEPYLIDGLKILRDDERFDVWEDATTLYFHLLKANDQKPLREGILRLPAAEFFGEQLPSFKATHTDDPARQSWALAAFGKFFFGHLVDIYVPELDRVVDVVKSITERTHV